MFDLIVRIVVRKVIITSVVLFFVSCLSDWGFGSGDVDLKKATWLVAEKVPLVVDKGGVPVGGGGTVAPVNDLFTLKPGTKVKAQALGAVDPTGTTILNDFDGDGILNINETTTNVWVADYPEIDATIAPPITLKIAILKNTIGETDEITSNVSSNDLESKKNEGSESVHQNEVNLKTVQFQDQFKSDIEESKSNSMSTSIGAGGGGPGGAATGAAATALTGGTAGLAAAAGPLGILAAGLQGSYSTTNSWSKRVALESTTTKWADKPFKNNIDREATSVKSDSASTKARKYRNEKSTKTNETSKIETNAGYVRAALYIKNRSVNMPVRLTNILCTLMFETSRGDLLPVQSFRLRNDDYSLFQVEVYGGSEFGPYVVELGNLNTVEIENAIAAGYTPKIFIVDYTMTHVADSNYKSTLLNYNGDNLKIVEENAKGRTALVKVYGPEYREKFRVAAFDDLSITNPCTTVTASQLAPGVTLKKALERIACSGVAVEFSDYVLDLADLAPSLNDAKVHIKGIKSFAGIPTNIPCDNQTSTGSDGVQRTACVQRPITSWTDDERKSAGVWAIYAKGKYNDPTEYWVDGSNIRIFDPGSVRKAQMLKGVDSIIWAGDNYDIVYISFKDLAKNEEFPPYGSTPIGSTPTGGGIDPNSPESYFIMNTKWDLPSLGDNPYEPDVNSKFLGKIGFGEKLVLTIKLDQTSYLNPNFGSSVDMTTYDSFSDFKYTPTIATRRFNFDEVMDFEMSLGFGGTRTDWVHILKDTVTTDETKLKKLWIDTSGYTDQTFRICLQMPTDSLVVDPTNSLVTVYLRPSLNSAYRRTVWPLRYTDVKKLRGELGAQAASGATSIFISNGYGNIEANDKVYIGSDPVPYVVTGSPVAGTTQGTYTVQLDSALRSGYVKSSLITVSATITEPDLLLSVTKNFLSDWNNDANTSPVNNPNLKQNLPLIENGIAPGCVGINQFHPLGCLGYNPDYNAINWMGSYNKGIPYWNNWTDGGNIFSFLANGNFELGTVSGKSYKATSVAQDFVVSDPVGIAVTDGEPVSVSSGDAMMVLWQQDTSIMGKTIKVTDGGLVYNQFSLASSMSSVTELTARLDNGKVTIIWENGLDVYIAIRNFADGAIILAPTKVATRVTNMGTYSRIGLAVGSGRALVGWSDMVAIPLSLESTRTIKAKIYDTSTGAVTVAAFNVYTVNSWNDWRYEMSTDGVGSNYALIGRHWADYSGNQSTVNYSVINLTTGASVSSGTLSTNGIVAPGTVYVAAGANYAFQIFKAASGTWYGRSINLATGALVGSDNLTLVLNPAFIRANVVGDTAYVQYSINGALQIKAISLAANQFHYTNALTLSSIQTGSVQRSSAIVSSSDGVLFSAWENTDGTKKTMRGRTFTFSPWAPKGSSEFFLSTLNQGPQSGMPEVGVYQSRALPVWKSTDTTTQTIRGFKLDIVSPGSLKYGLNNFFISPLIERDYKINASIIP